MPEKKIGQSIKTDKVDAATFRERCDCNRKDACCLIVEKIFAHVEFEQWMQQRRRGWTVYSFDHGAEISSWFSWRWMYFPDAVIFLYSIQSGSFSICARRRCLSAVSS
jgi:hypothetical protein